LIVTCEESQEGAASGREISVASTEKFRLPSTSVLLGGAGVILLILFSVVGSIQLRSTNQHVEAAEQVQDSASRVTLLVQVQPALNNELLTTGLESGEMGVLESLPLEDIVPDMESMFSLEEAYARVDGLLDALGDEQLQQDLANTRELARVGGPDSVSIATRYNEVSLALVSLLELELVELNSAAGATSSVSISQAAHLAAGAAQLESTTLQLDGAWALLEASMILTPQPEDVPRLAQGIATFNEQSALFETLAPPTGPIRESWDEFRSSEELPRLFQQYEATAERFSVEGLAANVHDSDSELPPMDVGEMLALAERIQAGLDDSVVLGDRLSTLSDVTLDELSASAQAALTAANQSRQFTILALIVASVLVALAAILGVVCVSWPIRRLAEAATRISRGDLDVQVPERGPSDVRIGARAINEALGSLRQVEAQATALAEQRLDARILDDAAPGALGRSLQAAVSRLADSVNERDEIQTRLEYEAGHDSLTKLANRRTLFEHLSTRPEDELFGLLFIDLDGFKLLNDTYGHHVGDKVLKVVAERISGSIRHGAEAARLGGDEFVVATETLSSSTDALVIAERLYNKVTEPMTFEGLTIVPQISVGITMSTESESPTQMLKDADFALYQSKADKSQRIVLYDEELRDTVDRQSEMEQDIRRGLKNDDFVLLYQPIVSSSDLAATDIESLIRWKKDDGTLVSPFHFIPCAERSDLIIELDRWVLNRVAEQIAAGAFPQEIRVSVNISGRHLSSGKLAANVASAVERHNIDPGRLVIEITETSILEDFATAEHDLATLRDLGVAVALDDFGTGFMSLAYLRSLPVDILKIDKSFVDEIETTEGSSIIQLIIDTGHLLSLSIVAEGVETERQAELLTEMGVDVLQGYFFARPGPLSSTAPIADAIAA